MRKAWGPLWCYDLRYGIDWRIPVVLGAILVLMAVWVICGPSNSGATAEQQRQMEARCAARGGHLVMVLQKFGVSRVCFGA